MVRVKKCYLLVEVSFKSGKCTRYPIYPGLLEKSLQNEIHALHGDVGLARVRPSLRVLYSNALTNLFTVVIEKEYIDLVKDGVNNFSSIGTDCSGSMKVIHVSHTVKQVNTFLARHQRQVLLKQLPQSNPEERKKILERTAELNQVLRSYQTKPC